MWSIVRTVYWILAVLLLSGCSGSGCSGCAGGALHEIPGGYPITPETRLPRAAQIRLTTTGLSAVQAIAPGLLSSLVGTGINVPTSSTSVAGIGQAVICPAGDCASHISLPTGVTPLQLAFQAPSSIAADIRLVIQGSIPITACAGGCDSSCNGTFCLTIASPTLNINTAAGSPPYLGLSTNIAITRDTHASRLDYHRADFVSPTGSGAVIQETAGEGLSSADITCTSSWVCGLFSLLSGTIVSEVSGELGNALGPITSALAQKPTPNPPGCPTGTSAGSGSTCLYTDMTDVPDLLGTEGTGNFGALLASITPGLQAPATYLLASGDHMHDAQIINSGMSLDLFGAMQSGGHNVCVPHVAEPALATIPEWTTLETDTIPGTTTAMDLGVGVSQDYLNHAAYQLWDSGLFCLGVTTATSQQLSGGLLSLLISSLPYVTFPNSLAPMAVTLRPQEPPTVVVGHGTDPMTDPLLTVTLPRLAIDFYAWSEERYVRIMTVTGDLSLPLDLQVDATGLSPVLGTLALANVATTNSQLLSNDPMALATAVQSILSAAVGPLLHSIPAIALPTIPLPGTGGTSLGSIAINVPAMGIQGVTEGSSHYLGLFANLTYTPAGMMHDSITLSTTAHLDSLQVNPAFFHIPAAMRVQNLPRVNFTVGTPNSFGHAVEYSYEIDAGTWSRFSSEIHESVQDLAFAAQGSHTIQVRARIAGQPNTADTNPARISFVIDTEAPHLRARIDGDTVVATATDDVSPTVAYAYQFDNHARTEWGDTTHMAIPTGTASIRVFAQDPTGNVAEVAVARTALLRGGPSSTASSGCGCTVAGADSSPRSGLLGMAGLLAALGFLSRRPRDRKVTARASSRRSVSAALPLCVFALAIVAGACSTTGNSVGTGHDSGIGNGGDTGTTMTDSTVSAMCGSTGMLCASSNTCITAPMCPTCQPGFAPMGAPTFTASTCMFDTSSCTCMRQPPLSPGAAGTYLDMATATDGTVWLSGYSEGIPDQNQLYGDLIVGQVGGELGAITWTHVDGVPSTPPTNDPSGWRGGVSDPGPDVGRFTSLAMTSDNHPRVAYWDVDNSQLKYASFDGTHWTTETVDSAAPNGKYASLILLTGNVPQVAYRATVVHGMVVSSVVRVARASSATPMAATDWTTTDVVTTPTLCRAGDCPSGTVCQQSNGQCVPTSTACTAACTAPQVCIGTACADVYASSWVEAIPPGVLYTHMVADAMGRLYITWYNRDRGNLMLVTADASGHWGTPTILDGEDAMGNDTGDRGIYDNLAIASDGSLHIAYVDGWAERLLYLAVTPGTAAGTPEVIDDGSAAGSTPFTDGLHIVGDSPSIQVLSTGAVQVVYGDSTAGTLRLASRAAMGGTSPWTLSILDQTNSTGYWANISGTHVATWWRDLSMAGMRQWGVRVTTLP